MNNKITLVESMAALRKQLHEIESKTINEGLKDAVEILPNIIKFWSKKPAAAIIKEFKTIEVTLPSGAKEVWNVTGIKNGEAVYSRAGDNAIASFDDITKSGTVKNVKTEPSLMPEPSIPPKTAEPTNVVGIDGKPYKVPKEEPIRPTGGDEIKQVDVSGPDPLHPKRIDPSPFKNIEAAKAAADAEIQAGNAIVKAPDGTVFQSAADMESFIAKNYPESAALMAANPRKTMNLWSWFSKPKSPAKPPRDPFRPAEPEKHTKKTGAVILLVALLLMWGLWPKKNTGGGGGGSSGSEDGSAPIGTVIPADEMPWKWVATGSTDPNIVIKNANVPGGYNSLKSQSVTKNESGKWQTPSGNVLNANGPTAARLEQLAKMDPEKRKEMARAEKSVIDNSVEMWPAGSLPDTVPNPNNTPELPPVGSEVPNNTTPDITTKPDIVIGKDDAEKKKKKKDEKVLPSSKW